MSGLESSHMILLVLLLFATTNVSFAILIVFKILKKNA